MAADDIAKGGLGIVKRLIPPIDGDPWHRFRYDLTVSIFLIGGGFVGTLLMLYVFGALTWMGITAPFASAQTMNNVEQQQLNESTILTSIQAGQINDKIRDAKKQVCLAIQAKNQNVLDAWARELENQKQQYREKIHQEPQVMGCDELLIGGTQG